MARKRLQNGLSYFDLIKSNDINYTAPKKLVISDCDGVLTDGNSIYGDNGKVFKIYGAYDTEMMSFMRLEGWDFIFVSKDLTGMEITTSRAKDMKSELSILGGKERYELVKEKMEEYEIVLFVGDSLSDIQAMSAATYAACPNNAVAQVKPYVDYISNLSGGHGAFGEILLWMHNMLRNDN